MMTGPIAINSATFVGIRIAGIPSYYCYPDVSFHLCYCFSLSMDLFKYKELTVIHEYCPLTCHCSPIASVGMPILSWLFGEKGLSINPQNINFVSVLFTLSILILFKWKPNSICNARLRYYRE